MPETTVKTDAPTNNTVAVIKHEPLSGNYLGLTESQSNLAVNSMLVLAVIFGLYFTYRYFFGSNGSRTKYPR